VILFRGGNYSDEQMLQLLRRVLENCPEKKLVHVITVVDRVRIRRCPLLLLRRKVQVLWSGQVVAALSVSRRDVLNTPWYQWQRQQGRKHCAPTTEKHCPQISQMAAD